MLAARLPGSRGGLLKFAWLDNVGGALQRAYIYVLDHVLRAPIVFIAVLLPCDRWCRHHLSETRGRAVTPEDRGRLTAWLVGPDGVGLQYTDRQVERVERILQPYLEQGLVRDVFTIAGRWDINRGYVLAPLIPWSERTVTQQKLEAKLRKKLRKIPGARVRTYGGNSLGLRGAGRGIRFALTGADYDNWPRRLAVSSTSWKKMPRKCAISASSSATRSPNLP